MPFVYAQDKENFEETQIDYSAISVDDLNRRLENRKNFVAQKSVTSKFSVLNDYPKRQNEHPKFEYNSDTNLIDYYDRWYNKFPEKSYSIDLFKKEFKC